MIVTRLFFCPDHVYTGHFGQAPGTAPMVASDRVELVADRGIVGDRYFNRPAGHQAQLTLFAEETWAMLCRTLGRFETGPDVFRRNVLVRGADLRSLVGAEFEVQGIRLGGLEHCKPCFWMDHAFGPGAFAALTAWQAGGLRARILSSGTLRVEAEPEAPSAP